MNRFNGVLLCSMIAINIITTGVLAARIEKMDKQIEVLLQREPVVIEQQTEEKQESEQTIKAQPQNAETTPEYEWENIGELYITGYDPYCKHCCGKSDGVTASGVKAEIGMVAMKDLPFGTRIRIEGMGEYVVQDRGVKSGVVDVVCENHDECYKITGIKTVWVYKEPTK